jgi:hypothetical protein
MLCGVNAEYSKAGAKKRGASLTAAAPRSPNKQGVSATPLPVHPRAREAATTQANDAQYFPFTL